VESCVTTSFWDWYVKNRMNSALVFKVAVTKMTATLMIPMLRNARINLKEMDRMKIILF
jgi:hypothetical protein